MNKFFISIIIFIFILFSQIINLIANDDAYINSSNITYNEKENIIELAENSKINFKNINVFIDKGIIDYNKNEFEVFGNFYLYEEFTILSGQDLKGNANLETFSANNVNYIYNDDLKIDTEFLNRDKNLIYFYNNFLTPCELEGYFNCPTWSLRINKTEYDNNEDKFTHFDTFLQIADYKVFYLPYFTHYGAKAPRKRGFLTPTFEFIVGGDQGIITPYYYPISQNTDILFKPKISFDKNFEFSENYELDSSLETKHSGGITSISINNIKNENYDNLKSTLKIDTKQVINENTKFSASGLFTNSISTARSINKDPITFEDIFIKLENYNFFTKDDYLKTELSSIETFETTKFNEIPISPSFHYLNFYDQDNFTLKNEAEFSIIKRTKSSLFNPSESFKININNEILKNYYNKKLSIDNKIIFNNSLNEYFFNNHINLNHSSFKSNLVMSSDINFRNINFITPRTKFILPIQFNNTNKKINELSESISFNYLNQYSENRFFGNDLLDTTPRVVYGFTNYFNINKLNFDLNINQSLDINNNNSYADKINQKTNLSDYAIETKISYRDILLKLDSRLNKNNLSKKEMNYSFHLKNPIELTLNYNQTQRDAYKSYSKDTESINFIILKKINNNINLSYNSNLDLKNNYNPYKSSVNLSLFDECSKLEISYSNLRYNDNFNTVPKETIGLTFSMDYLGFFGYQQSTDLLFQNQEEI